MLTTHRYTPFDGERLDILLQAVAHSNNIPLRDNYRGATVYYAAPAYTGKDLGITWDPVRPYPK